MKNNIFKNRRFRHGTLATVMTIVFIAAVVLVNVIATILLEKFPLNIDLTKNQSFQMAEDSKDFLRGVDRDVSIKVFAQEEAFSNGGFYYVQALNTMKQCTQYNSQISLEFIDLEKNPQYGRDEYEDANIATGSIIVESDLRYKSLTVDDFFELSYDNYYYTGQPDITESHAESALMSAIMYVTEADPVEIVVLTNNSPVGADGLQNLLTQNNYSFTEINLLSQDIPEDAEVVLIAAPTVDYTTEEVEKLEQYLNNGGSYGKKLVYIASYQQQELPVLEGYLANDWGLELGQGIVYETDSSNMYGMYPWYGFQTLTGSMFAEGIDTASESVLAPMARPITLEFPETESTITNVSLITTSDTTVVMPMDADENWDPADEEQQSYVTAAAATRLKYEQGTNEELTSTVVVFGSDEFMDSSLMSMDVFLNGEFAVQMFNDLSGKEENTLNIVPKTANTDTLDITQSTVNVVMILFVIVVPIAVFATGLVIWLKRRHQ